jgi:hypothetical protein
MPFPWLECASPARGDFRRNGASVSLRLPTKNLPAGGEAAQRVPNRLRIV